MISKRDAVVMAVDARTADPVLVVDAILDLLPDTELDNILNRFPIIKMFYEEHREG